MKQVYAEKVETKSKTQRHLLSHFLEGSAVEFAMVGREEGEEEDFKEEEADPC